MWLLSALTQRVWNGAPRTATLSPAASCLLLHHGLLLLLLLIVSLLLLLVLLLRLLLLRRRQVHHLLLCGSHAGVDPTAVAIPHLLLRSIATAQALVVRSTLHGLLLLRHSHNVVAAATVLRRRQYGDAARRGETMIRA